MKVPKPRKLNCGTWFIQLRLGGESIPVTARTEKECIRQAEYVKAEYRNGKREKAEGQDKADDTVSMTLAEAIDKYIQSRKRRLKETSIAQYEYIRDHRFQTLMPLPLGEITTQKLDEAMEQELAKPSRRGGPISPRTVTDAYSLIVSVMKKYAPKVETKISMPEIQRTFPELIHPQDVYNAVKGTDVELPCLLCMWESLKTCRKPIAPPEISGTIETASVRR